MRSFGYRARMGGAGSRRTMTEWANGLLVRVETQVPSRTT
jgi:hypothetical protein